MADEDAAKVESTTETKTETKKKSPIAAIIGAVALVVAAVVLCIFLTRNKVVGKYNLYSYIQNGEESTSMVDLLKSFGMNVTIEFKGDKTGAIETVGGDETNTQKFTYDDKKVKIENNGETEESDYKLDGDYVTVTIGNEEMKFKRDGK